MHEALKEFVKGEWLEGDNAYFCEKCQEKVLVTCMAQTLQYLLLASHCLFVASHCLFVASHPPAQRDTLKRTCIKTLPPVLVIHLKRFGYDWEAGRAIKCDDHFEVNPVMNVCVCARRHTHTHTHTASFP